MSGRLRILTEPADLVRRLKKRVIAINGRVLPVEDIFDFANRAGRRFPDPPNVQGHEEQLMRIDVTGVDETLSLLGATAGVVCVHQAALVVHELVKIAAGSGQALPEVVGRHLQDFAADAVADAEDFTEREDQPLLAVQAEQHPGRAGDFGFFDEQRHIHGHALRIGQVQVGRVVDGGRVTGEGAGLQSRRRGASCSGRDSPRCGRATCGTCSRPETC